MSEVAMGQKVREITTDREGYIVGHTVTYGGAVQWLIQFPANAAGEVPDPNLVDGEQLQVLHKGLKATAPDENISIEIGQRVRDKVTGFEGTTTERLTWLNGCVHFIVAAKAPEGATLSPRTTRFEHQRLEAVAPAPEPAKSKKKATGGPSRRLTEISA